MTIAIVDEYWGWLAVRERWREESTAMLNSETMQTQAKPPPIPQREHKYVPIGAIPRPPIDDRSQEWHDSDIMRRARSTPDVVPVPMQRAELERKTIGSLGDVVVSVCLHHFGVTWDRVVSSKRGYARTCMCRKAIAYLLRTKCFMSFQEIAAYMNRIDHTTAMHNVESWTDLSESDRVMLLKAVDKAMEA